jgi:hypothetical protein
MPYFFIIHDVVMILVRFMWLNIYASEKVKFILLLLIAACHVHCIIQMHRKLCRWSMITTVPVQCSSLPCWVCRHESFALHSYAFTKYIWCDVSLLLLLKVYYLSLLLFGSCFLHRYYMLLILDVEFYIKSLLNTTCGLNNSSKQIYLLRCFISPLHYSF